MWSRQMAAKAFVGAPRQSQRTDCALSESESLVEHTFAGTFRISIPLVFVYDTDIASVLPQHEAQHEAHISTAIASRLCNSGMC
jgi:hypothetical protein